MTRTIPFLSIGAMSCLLLCTCIYAQEPGGRPQHQVQESQLRMIEAEIDLKMHELELKQAELAVDEASIEIEKIEVQFRAAREKGNSHEVAHIGLEPKQAEIRVDIGKVQLEMTRLGIERSRAALKHVSSTFSAPIGRNVDPGISIPMPNDP
ncbi:MAG: hypothetical protein JXM70_24535 [Pirellulales bacterium]|nr:hypothetical protein [Pirellulales bacterium]